MAKATVNPYDPEVMRARFWVLEDEIKKVDAELAPLQAEAEKIAAFNAREFEVNQLLKEANQRRYDLQVEKARLANALSGKTGESADQPYDAEAAAKFHADNPSVEAETPAEDEVPAEAPAAE